MTNGLLVFQSDFGNSDGAVSAMHGVANSVQLGIPIFEITHQIPQYNIREASIPFTTNSWLFGQVELCCLYCGSRVSSNRRSVVAKTINNHYIITPDNGTLTHIKEFIEITDVRIIDETINRLPKSGESHTFHGRDIFAFTGARLASGLIKFEAIGPVVRPTYTYRSSIKKLISN